MKRGAIETSLQKLKLGKMVKLTQMILNNFEQQTMNRDSVIKVLAITN